MQRKDGKRKAVKGAEGNGPRQQKELMGKGRGCAEENGKRRAVEGVEGKGTGSRRS
jgi:hypothetical protein